VASARHDVCYLCVNAAVCMSSSRLTHLYVECCVLHVVACWLLVPRWMAVSVALLVHNINLLCHVVQFPSRFLFLTLTC